MPVDRDMENKTCSAFMLRKYNILEIKDIVVY
jgi:hypothetical protein